jgi:hypothetical protein
VGCVDEPLAGTFVSSFWNGTVGRAGDTKVTIKEQVSAIAKEFVHGLRCILGDKLHAAYVYGAAAFPDDVPTGDIDFHVILNTPLTDDERANLYALHDSLARDFPPLGVDMDGYYILLTDARGAKPPQSQMWQGATDTAWALHREHIRAGRYIAFHGPDPKQIYLQATWQEVEEALQSELRYVEDHLDQYPDFCILQICRLVYTYETGNPVVSKAQAADWAREALPQWSRHLEVASKTYPGRATPEERQSMLADIGALLEFVRTKMSQTRQRLHP